MCDICDKTVIIDLDGRNIHMCICLLFFMLFCSTKIFLDVNFMRKFWLRGWLNDLQSNTLFSDRPAHHPHLTPLNGGLWCLKTKVQTKDTRKKALRMSSRSGCRNWVISVWQANWILVTCVIIINITNTQ